MSSKSHMEEIFRKKLYSAEANPPADMFERIAAARSRKKKFVLWRDIAALIIIASLGAGGYWWSTTRTSVPVQPTTIGFDQMSSNEKSLKGNIRLESNSEKSNDEDSYSNETIATEEASTQRGALAHKTINTRKTDVHAPSDRADKNEEPKIDLVIEQEPTADPKSELIPVPDEPENEGAAEVVVVQEDAVSPNEDLVAPDDKLVDADVPEEENENNVVPPKPFVSSPWSFTLMAGAGGFHPQFDLAESVKSQNSRQVQAFIQYSITPAWTIETGIIWSNLNMNMQETREQDIQTISINEQNVWVYDPILPPVMRTFYDTSYGMRKEKYNLDATYSRQLWSIPLSFSRNWYTPNWSFSAVLGGQLHVVQKHEGSIIGEALSPIDAQPNLVFSARTSVLTSLRAERRISDHFSLLLAPSAFADVQASRWKGDLNRRDLWWTLNTGVRYKF